MSVDSRGEVVADDNADVKQNTSYQFISLLKPLLPSRENETGILSL